jgi:hypothetical protein
LESESRLSESLVERCSAAESRVELDDELEPERYLSVELSRSLLPELS